MEMIFHSHANSFHKKGCALGLILKVNRFGPRKWPIVGKKRKENCTWTGQRSGVCRLVPSLYLFNIVKMKLLYEGYMKGCATLDYRAAISGIISQAVLLVPWLITNTVSSVPWEVPPYSTGYPGTLQPPCP